MEILKSGLKSVLGGPQDSQPSGADTVEKLVNRVQTSTLLDDRRDACRALKALSKKFRLEVGVQGMDVLLKVLERDRADSEIVGFALDAICNVISGPQEEEEYETDLKNDENLGLQFTEIFIKNPENVSLLLSLMEEYDFKVRWPVVKLLTALLIHKPKDLQECILISPMGVSKLMDLLTDTREIIRNDTLLLLAHLTKGNANIQKIVAFENAFDELFSIIKEERYSDGGVIVEDCLLVLQTLLKNNSSNQSLFKEGSYIQHIAPFFDLGDTAEKGWSPQKATNIHMMLYVVRVLVSPNNPLQVTASSQKAMFQCGLLEQLCNILMASGIPADILTETINTVAEILRGNHANQEYFSTINAPISPPRPAIFVLLMPMLNEKQPFVLRCAVLYFFQCFLYKNELGQAKIVQTLLPSSSDVLNVSIGQLLCGGLFSTESLSNWLAAVALSHSIVDNPTQKEQLLRVQLATGVGSPAVSLMNQFSIMLQQGSKLQTRLGLLMLMCTWLAHCPNAVAHFLNIATNVPFLTAQVGITEFDESEDIIQGLCAFLLGICIEFNDNSNQGQFDNNTSKDDLCQLVVKRIGLEKFLGKLGAVSKNENYSRSAQNPHLKFKEPAEVLFDYEFCRLFKSLEGIIIKAVQPEPITLNGPETNMNPAQQDMLQQYKDLIREQDLQLQDLKTKLSNITAEYEKSKTQHEYMGSTVQQLRDQNALLKAQKAVSGSSFSNSEVVQLKEELDELKAQCAAKGKSLEEKDSEIHKLKEQLKLAEGIHTQSEHQTAAVVDDQSKEVIERQKAELQQFNEKIQTFLFQLEQQNIVVQKLESEKNNLMEEKNEIEKQQEDGLLLLYEQEDKLKEYRKRLRELGEQIDEDIDEDLDEEDPEQDLVEEAASTIEPEIKKESAWISN